VVGQPELAVRICERALQRGIFAQAIRPPTVPQGTSRLRLATMASHRPEELRRAARTLGQVARAEGFEPRLADFASLAETEPPPAGVFDFEAPAPVARAA
jgi:glycine C-acetyltransferase/8-amino-7-oxononanoate synthase